MERWNVGRGFILGIVLTFQLSIIPTVVSAQRKAITFEDYIALKAVSDPQLSPDGKWVAYTVSTPSLQDNRNVARVWVADVATGKARQLPGGRDPTASRAGPPTERRWRSSRPARAGHRSGCAIAGGDAHKVSSWATGRRIRCGSPDGSGLLVVSDIKWPANQEIDQRNGAYPTEARIWTGLMWRHWDDFRAGKRQHLFRVDVATGKATDLTPVDHDVPTIATGGDGERDGLADVRHPRRVCTANGPSPYNTTSISMR